MNEENVYSEILEERRNPNKEFLSTLNFFIVVLALFLCFTVFFTQILVIVQVSGSSMEPTLYGGAKGADGKYYGGDFLFVYTPASIEYGEIIVFQSDEKDSIKDSSSSGWLIKRVIGLPGDTIRIENSILYRKHGDGEFVKVEEPYLDPNDGWMQTLESDYYVEDGFVYVLGDHRSVSHDSRAFGAIPAENIMGVVPDWSVEHKDGITGFFEIFT